MNRIYGAIVQQVARYIFVFRHDSITLKLWVRALRSLDAILLDLNVW